MKGLKQSLEYAYAEIDDLKHQQELSKICNEETKKRIQSLENENTTLHDSIVDLKARSMRDNSVFFNISKHEKEDTTVVIHSLLEEKFELLPGQGIMTGKNARKLKGTRIGVSEEFPEEIERVRKAFYPEYKKPKAEKKRTRMIRDKLIIEGVVFKLT
ncbi:Hypothetical predicted protein [Paramuricea clavata]|uniref:Uncharacterized protein n=1 Tax=Paramuricea clavata TaxID=317549 RepID=A0A7D9H951_PARCT|nr:Hypothetical predicted protein [Paramuricea clavata]